MQKHFKAVDTVFVQNTVDPEIFVRILFLRIALKTYLRCLNLQLGHDLPMSVIDRVTEMRSFAKNKTLAKISEFTVIMS